MNKEYELGQLVPARGWVVKYDDGSYEMEWRFQKNFSQLPNVGDLAGVAIVHDGKSWSISGKRSYFSGKQWSAYLAFGSNMPPMLEARYIGYYDGNKKIMYRVEERTGKMTILVTDS